MPVANTTIDKIPVPEANTERGTCVIYFVSMNSLITTDPEIREIRNNTREITEKNSNSSGYST